MAEHAAENVGERVDPVETRRAEQLRASQLRAMLGHQVRAMSDVDLARRLEGIALLGPLGALALDARPTGWGVMLGAAARLYDRGPEAGELAQLRTALAALLDDNSQCEIAEFEGLPREFCRTHGFLAPCPFAEARSALAGPVGGSLQPRGCPSCGDAGGEDVFGCPVCGLTESAAIERDGGSSWDSGEAVPPPKPSTADWEFPPPTIAKWLDRRYVETDALVAELRQCLDFFAPHAAEPALQAVADAPPTWEELGGWLYPPESPGPDDGPTWVWSLDPSLHPLSSLHPNLAFAWKGLHDDTSWFVRVDPIAMDFRGPSAEVDARQWVAAMQALTGTTDGST